MAHWLLHLLTALIAAEPGAPAPLTALTTESSDEMLWLVVGEREGPDKPLLNRFAYMDIVSPQIRPVRILPQRGHVLRAAAVGESLHVFYEGGAHYRYSTDADRREVRLPGAAVPAAVAGSTGERVATLWAVVDHDVAVQVAEQWERLERERSTQPAEPLPRVPSPLSIASRPDGIYGLVRYDGDTWRPGEPLPAECRSAARIWLCVGGGRFHLFWRQPGETAVSYAFMERGRWSSGPAIGVEQPINSAYVGISNSQLIFAALTGDSTAPLRPHAWLRQDADSGVRWNLLPLPKDSDQRLLELPAGAAVSVFAENLVFLTHDGEKAGVGSWRLWTGQPDQPPREVPLRPSPTEPEGRRGLRDFTATLVVAILLVLVFWRRQESLSTPAPLPPGMDVVRPGKRALAALVDALPAGIIVGAVWRQEILSFWQEVQAASNVDPTTHVPWPDTLKIAWLVFCGSYTAYSAAFELALARTPGKMLLRLDVVSETIARPSKAQILIRNVSRMIELLPQLQIWPFLLVIFLTRNRQRIGDLVARTIVVERSRVLQPPDGDRTDLQA